MAGIKEFNNKIKSLKNTKKITKTMKMVSASKLRRAQEARMNAKAYADHITALTSRISASTSLPTHPLMIEHKAVKRAHILVFASDRGLCGAFNLNCFRQVNAWIRENRSRFEKIELSFCGKRGFNFFRKIENIKTFYENVTGKPKFEDAEKIGKDLADTYINGEYDEVYLAYNSFISPLVQKTTFEKILPLDPKSLSKNENIKPTDYIFEPTDADLLEFLIPQFLYFKVFFALLENSAGEHGARMSAMDNATKNSTELMNKYTLLRNRARQAKITTELTEIVAGSEALN